jgi:hypothetical protein
MLEVIIKKDYLFYTFLHENSSIVLSKGISFTCNVFFFKGENKTEKINLLSSYQPRKTHQTLILVWATLCEIFWQQWSLTIWTSEVCDIRQIDV